MFSNTSPKIIKMSAVFPFGEDVLTESVSEHVEFCFHILINVEFLRGSQSSKAYVD